MQDPWQILILDPNTATVRDVKAAYARLLKIHRPDKDPEGFTRVREAYEAALAWVTSRTGRSAPDTMPAVESTINDPPQQAPFNPTSPEAPAKTHDEEISDADGWQTAVNALRRQVVLQDAFGVRQAAENLLDLAETTDMPADRIAKALAEALGSQLESIAVVITDALLLRLVHGGESGIAHQVVALWQQLGKLERLQRFGEYLVALKRPADDQEEALIMARTGTAIGFWEPNLATELADAAFPRLPAEVRQHVMNELEHQCSLGHLFEDFPQEMRHFWRERSSHEPQVFDWNTSEGQNALDYAAKMRSRGWNGLGYVKSIVPEEVWISLVRKIEAEGARSRYAGLASEPASSRTRLLFSLGGFTIFIVYLVIILSGAGSLENHSVNHSYSPSETDPQRLYEKFLHKTMEIPPQPQQRQNSKPFSPYEAITTPPKPANRPDYMFIPSVTLDTQPGTSAPNLGQSKAHNESLFDTLLKRQSSTVRPATNANASGTSPAPPTPSKTPPSENDLRNGTLWQGAVPGLRR